MIKGVSPAAPQIQTQTQTAIYDPALALTPVQGGQHAGGMGRGRGRGNNKGSAGVQIVVL